MKKKLICITGPTASGKTALSIELAKYFHTEIISADSRQFYKEMSIGTAVPSPEELSAAPHHFIQHKSIFDEYTVGDFETDFISLSEILFQKLDTIILVGGSGLYIDAAIKGLDNLPGKNHEIRAELEQLINEKGLIALQDEVRKLDPEFYKRMDIQNPHRLIRAIEILRQSPGKTMDELRNKRQKRSFDTVLIALDWERQKLYDRINKRVDIMMKQGLEEEARKLYPHKHLNALNTVGYKELFGYFENAYSKEFAVSEIKKNTRRFAKRQLTWFRKNKDIRWFDPEMNFSHIIKYVEKEIEK